MPTVVNDDHGVEFRLWSLKRAGQKTRTLDVPVAVSSMEASERRGERSVGGHLSFRTLLGCLTDSTVLKHHCICLGVAVPRGNITATALSVCWIYRACLERDVQVVLASLQSIIVKAGHAYIRLCLWMFICIKLYYICIKLYYTLWFPMHHRQRWI